MRLVPLLALVLLVAAACGAGETVSGGEPASTAQVEQEPTESLPAPDAQGETPQPPAITLVAGAGRQEAEQGSYCINDPEGGVGVCADTGPIDPERLSVVRPGEEVRIAVAGADAAEGEANIVRLGCQEAITSVRLTGPVTLWQADLVPGSYELELFATFERGSASGDVSGSLGLLVDEAGPQKILPVPDELVACPGG